MAERLDPSAELWKLANIVTGFAVAQGMAFAVALGTDLGSLQSLTISKKLGVTLVAIVFATAYSIAVHRCWKLAPSEPLMDRAWRETTYGRHTAIWLFTALGVFGLFAPNIFG